MRFFLIGDDKVSFGQVVLDSLNRHSVNVKVCYHLGFTGLVQLKDGLFQLFVGITISSK